MRLNGGNLVVSSVGFFTIMVVWGWCLLALGLCTLTAAQQERRRTGNVCKVDMDCPDNAFCKSSTYCVCKDGFIFAAIEDSHACLKEASVGEFCDQDIQCHSKLGVQSECTPKGVCACKDTAHFEKERCHETFIIGEQCVVDENCYLGDRSDPEKQAFCYRGFCSCIQAHSPRENGKRCVRDAELGDTCEDNEQCAGAGLECSGTCKCKEGWVAHVLSKGCLQAVTNLGDPCDFDVQCKTLSGTPDAPNPGAAMCLGGVCSCAYSALKAGSPERCWTKRRPGQECHRDEECVSEEDEPGYCLNGHCTCKTCTPSPADFAGANALARPVLVPIVSVVFLFALMRH